MPISYKHKIYTTLGTPTDLSGNVVSATDSAGVPAKDYAVKGRTIVWNQLIQNGNFVNTTGWGVNNGTGSVSNNNYTFTVTGTQIYSFIMQYIDKSFLIANHKYYVTATIVPQYDTGKITVALHNGLGQESLWTGPASSGKTNFVSTTFIISSTFVSNATDKTRLILYCPQSESVQGNVTTISNVWMTDLTKMFGAGNEPSTTEEFRAMFPDDYYPYNAGELKSIVPTSIEASTINLLNLVGRKEISSDTVGRRTPTDAYPEIDTHVYYRGVSANGYLLVNTVAEATVLSSSVIAKTGENPGDSGYGVGIPLTVIPSTTYYIKCTTSGVISVGYANSNKIITKFTGELSGPNIAITTPEDCRYALIVFRPNAPDTLATFENICVSTVQTNEYQPYNKYHANIPSSKYFPDGMRSAGSVYDEINFLSQKAVKRIGIRAYQTGDENDANVMTDKINTVYILATPVETAITPPLQALSTFKGFTSFSVPNSLTQNGPLSVTYYAEGGTNPEKGWLTSYKRKLYMGRNIEWNQLLQNPNFSNTVVDTREHVVFRVQQMASPYEVFFASDLYGPRLVNAIFTISVSGKCRIKHNGSVNDIDFCYFTSVKDHKYYICFNFTSTNPTVAGGITYDKAQLFDLTQMFGAGNEPSTPEEFWSYFDHKLYPYNAGETQPLFKISRKSYIYKEPAGYTVYFADGIWIADTVTIFVEYTDGSTETLTSQNDMGGKSRSNVVKMTFTDTDSDRYVRYKMPAIGGSEETLYMMPTVTLVLTADAEIEEIGK